MTKTIYSKDVANKKILVTREFAAGIKPVWAAWTESELLDQWWAPRPWKANTKSFDFSEGGVWLYAMIGPDGTTSWCHVRFNSITPLHDFSTDVGFCDEEGNLNTEFPTMHWKCVFINNGDSTTVKVDISFDKEEDMNRIIEMGFEQGFAMGHDNLDELLAK
jgi:uncharacterized protein YndB with AHSA1/START domain